MTFAKNRILPLAMLGAALAATPALAKDEKPKAPASAVAMAGTSTVVRADRSQYSKDEAAILKLAVDVLDMYTLEDMSMATVAGRIYTPDEVAPPIVVDIGKSMRGNLWATSKAEWVEQIGKYVGMIGPNGPKDFRFTLQDPKFVIDRDLASMVALVPTSFVMKGKTIQLETRYTFVFMRVNGEWTLWHEHWSIPASPASVGM